MRIQAVLGGACQQVGGLRATGVGRPSLEPEQVIGCGGRSGADDCQGAGQADCREAYRNVRLGSMLAVRKWVTWGFGDADLPALCTIGNRSGQAAVFRRRGPATMKGVSCWLNFAPSSAQTLGARFA